MESSSDNDLIAIVDDDAAVRKALRRLILSMGLRAEGFASPAELLASGPQRFACLLLDVELPGMNGFELYRRARAHTGEKPVIFITARPDAGARRRAQEAGAVALLGKPFDDQVLFDAILGSLPEAERLEAQRQS